MRSAALLATALIAVWTHAAAQGVTVTGRVTAVSSVVGRNQLNPLDPRALQDRRVIEVTVRLDDPEPAARYVGMEVDVLINPGASGTGGQAK